MDSKHTPGPWELDEQEDAIWLSNHDLIISGMTDISDDDAHRIVDCVNACEGINPDAVNDLLKALQWIAENTIHIGSREIAQDAIDKATS